MKKIILVAIMLIGLFLRTFQLDNRPFGFTWDEAALGYNAYSLLKTARDEYGQLAPVIFKSFGDYKPGLYIYYTIPAIKLLGLNEFSTRLPSAIFGTLTLAVIYVLARDLFRRKSDVGIWVLVLATVNPWLIQFSRGAWEANLNLLLTTLAVAIFVRNLNRNSHMQNFLAFTLFGLTFWTYQSAKLFTPLLVFSLLLVYKKNISLNKLFLPFLLSLLLLIPVIRNFSGQSGRLKVFSVFSYIRKPEDVKELLRQDRTLTKNLTYYLFHTELLDQGRGVFQRYLNHFSPRFLFSQGDWTSLRHSVYKHGYFYLVEILTIGIGLFILLARLKNKSSKLLAAWLVLAPLPAAFSRDLVSGVRSLPLVIPLVIISALGLSWISKNKAFHILFTAFSIFFVIYYLDFYYVHQPYYSAVEWVSPYKKAVQDLKSHLTDYENFIITDKLGQPYIFVLFYLQFDPATYQAQAKLLENNSGDVGKVASFSRFSFQPVFWPQLRSRPHTLFIGDQYDLPEKDLDVPGLSRIDDIYYPNGQHALRVVGTL